MTTHQANRRNEAASESAGETERLAALWKECIAGWRNLVLAFGHPVDLVRWGWMRALEHRALGRWLRDLEELVRRAITSDALSRIVPAPSLYRRKRADKRCASPASPEDMARFRASSRTDPTSWKVSFQMSKREYKPTRRRLRTRRNREPAARRRCRGFAWRIEALRRAIQYREAYVMRYARRLARLDEAARIHDPILLPDPPAADPPDRRPIQLNAAVVDAPCANPIESPLRNAKYAEPG